MKSSRSPLSLTLSREGRGNFSHNRNLAHHPPKSPTTEILRCLQNLRHPQHRHDTIPSLCGSAKPSSASVRCSPLSPLAGERVRERGGEGPGERGRGRGGDYRPIRPKQPRRTPLFPLPSREMGRGRGGDNWIDRQPGQPHNFSSKIAPRGRRQRHGERAHPSSACGPFSVVCCLPEGTTLDPAPSRKPSAPAVNGWLCGPSSPPAVEGFSRRPFTEGLL